MKNMKTLKKLNKEIKRLELNIQKFRHTDEFNTLPDIQKSLLTIQYSSMVTYFKCLQERINYLEKDLK